MLTAAHLGQGIYDLPNFDEHTLSAHPAGELQLSLNNFDDLGDCFNNILIDPMSGENPQTHQAANTTDEAPSDIFDFLQFGSDSQEESPSTSSQCSMPPTPPATQTALSIDLNNVENIPKVSYVPPSGAPFASTRRVGGTWKPAFISHDDPLNQALACTTNGVLHS